MATLLSSIRSQARVHLNETTASFWTDAELLDTILKGVNDLWGAIIDLNREHFITVDESNVSLAANTGSLTGVPSDLFRVLLIEPRVTTPGTAGSGVLFHPAAYNSAQMRNARTLAAKSPDDGLTVFYTVTTAGAPVGAPSILVAPQLTAALDLRVAYVPSFGTLTASSNNPIPGESDNALIAWTVAVSRAKEREDRSPDPNWLGIYSTEKQNLLVRLTPRQTQEIETVEGVFDAYTE